jgi:hypothetical protein
MEGIAVDTKKIFTTYLRGVFYALTVVLGLALAFTELDNGNVELFWQLSVAVGLIFVIELYTGVDARYKRRRKQSLELIDQGSFPTLTLLVHNALIPLAIYVSIVTFTYFNSQDHLRLMVLVFSLGTFAILFTHTRAYYLSDEQLFRQTNYVYDLAKLLIFFTITDTLFNLAAGRSQPGLAVVVTGLNSFILLVLTLLRYQKIVIKGVYLSAAMAIAIAAACGTLISTSNANPLQIAFIAVVGYYISAAFIHHWIYKSITPLIIIEYICVAVAVCVVILSTT